MYCPNCGQQQVSEEMRFCSRCGLALTGLAEWLAGGSLPVLRQIEPEPMPAITPRRKNIRRAAKLMFFSGVLFPVFLLISIAIGDGGPMFVPFFVFFVSLVWMLYARLFSDNTQHVNYQAPQTTVLGPMPARGSLPSANTTSIPNVGRRTRTNELAQPPSVTENTTRFFDNES